MVSEVGSVMAREALVRISARPPKLFNSKVDFTLWMERLEIYFAEAEIPEEKKVKELCVLLEDDPFRIMSQLGLLESTDYRVVKSCLQQHFGPVGTELEWQNRVVESLPELAGKLRLLTDCAFPNWDLKLD